MKIKFKKPLVINYVKTDKGMMDIKDLDTEEFLGFCHLYQKTLAENRDKRKKMGNEEE